MYRRPLWADASTTWTDWHAWEHNGSSQKLVRIEGTYHKSHRHSICNSPCNHLCIIAGFVVSYSSFVRYVWMARVIYLSVNILSWIKFRWWERPWNAQEWTIVDHKFIRTPALTICILRFHATRASMPSSSSFFRNFIHGCLYNFHWIPKFVQHILIYSLRTCQDITALSRIGFKRSVQV